MKSVWLMAVTLLFSMNALAKGNAGNPTEVIVQGTDTIVAYRYVGVTTHSDDGEWRYPDGRGAVKG